MAGATLQVSDLTLATSGAVEPWRLKFTSKYCEAIPVMARAEGIMMAVPKAMISPAQSGRARVAGPRALMGPCWLTTVPLDAEGDSPTEVEVYLVDFALKVLEQLQPLADADDEEEDLEVIRFDASEALPEATALVEKAEEWLQTAGLAPRISYYTASEGEPLAEPKASRLPQASPSGTLPTEELSALIASTVAAALAPVTERLGALERRPTGDAAAAGPPPPRAAGAMPALAPPVEAKAPAGAVARRLLAATPKRLGEPGPSAVRPPPPPPVPIDVDAEDLNDTQTQLLLHTQALVRLMGSHGAGPSGDVAGPPGGGAGADVLGDLARSSSSSVGVRGSANRLRLQRALEAQPGALSLAVIRNMARRLGPLHAPGGVPDALEYLERFGAFADNFAGRPAAYQATLTAIALNHLMRGEYDQATDIVALTMVAQEQATLDHGRWTTAWLLTLQEDPPPAMLSRRTEQAPLRGFSALADPVWTTVALAYLKELDVLSNHQPQPRAALPAAAKAPGAEQAAEAEDGRPRRPTRRPKAKGE